MRILMLNYEFPPLGGGASPITGELSTQLALVGHEVDVVTMGFKGLPRTEVHGTLRIFRVPSVRRSAVVCSTPEMATYLPPALWQSLMLNRQRRYDIVHAHFLIPTAPIGVVVGKLCQLPLVVTIHGSDVPGYNPDRFQGGHQLLAPLWRWIVRHTDVIISPSAYLRDLLQQTLPTPVTLIPYGFHRPSQPPTVRKPRILAASRLFPRKGLHHFLDALATIDTTGWEIIIAGDGPARTDLEAQAQRLGIDVQFVGFVKGTALQELYASSEIFVFPSLRDNFAVVLLEAMSAGCAIIASNTAGTPEVVGDAGILVPPTDSSAIAAALRHLMHNPEARNELRYRAEQRIHELSWDVVRAQHESLYRRMLEA